MQRTRLLSGICSGLLLLTALFFAARQAFPTVQFFDTQKASTLASFAGFGNRDLPGVDTPPHWRIAWSCDPASSPIRRYNVIVTVKSTSIFGPTFALAVNTFCTDQQTSGVQDETSVGTVYLSVVSEGTWKIEIQALH